jgi:hypothetical protein
MKLQLENELESSGGKTTNATKGKAKGKGCGDSSLRESCGRYSFVIFISQIKSISMKHLSHWISAKTLQWIIASRARVGLKVSGALDVFTQARSPCVRVRHVLHNRALTLFTLCRDSDQRLYIQKSLVRGCIHRGICKERMGLEEIETSLVQFCIDLRADAMHRLDQYVDRYKGLTELSPIVHNGSNQGSPFYHHHKLASF